MSDLAEIKSLLKTQADILGTQTAEHKAQADKLDDIHFAIFGNRQAGVKGMAAIQEQHSKKLREYERFKWIATGATGASFAGLIAWVKQHLGI